ncbi:hypothetical protein ABIB82_004059 [Bradyrhizobium sp. i1.8.4]|uniref:hypothetical protein n=1 Tax=unclassified Bradyrhizobium TaxID=2631580 RepID=UPI003D238CE7
MPTNAPETRKTHVTRIFGTNKNGDRLDSMWADVERMEVVKSASQEAPDKQWQGTQRKLKWSDDPNADDYSPDGTPSRLFDTVKLCDPTGDVNDPDEWIPIKVIRSMRSLGGDGIGQGFQDRFLNSAEDDDAKTARIVEVRRIVHCDTNWDSIVQDAADADPSLREYVIPSSDYNKDTSTKDTDQYAEHEIITYLKHKGNVDELSGLGRQTKLLNQYMIDESEDATQKVVGANGINPPYRLDPYQNIVNVQLTPTVIVVFIDWVQTVPSKYSTRSIIDDKAIFLDQFEIPIVDNSIGAARGFAYKVSAAAGEFITSFGAPLTGPAAKIGQDILALVFAMDGDIDNSLARAKAGAKLVMPAAYLEAHGSNALASKVDPPGLLWSVSATKVPPGKPITWKIKWQKHRAGQATKPPNVMVQCYPLSAPYINNLTDPASVFTGYVIRVYRLDRKGTGQSYGGDLNPAALVVAGGNPAPPGSRMDPAWHQIIGSGNGVARDGKFRGIPFADPPPLIGGDNPSG